MSNTGIYISFSGTRHQLSPLQISCAVQLLRTLPASAPLATGCCATGLDNLVRGFCRSARRPLRVFAAGPNPAPAQLRLRTLAMVANSGTLFAFPSSATVPHSGTWLSIGAAVRKGIPVWVCPPAFPIFLPPTFGAISSWQFIQPQSTPFWPQVSFPFFQPVPAVIQQSFL